MEQRIEIHFINLTDAMRAEINSKDWGCPAGRAYLAAQEGEIDGTNFHLFQKVATLRAGSNNEVYARMQNNGKPWVADAGIAAESFVGDRSMSVGDIITWEDGNRYRVGTFGFEQI